MGLILSSFDATKHKPDIYSRQTITKTPVQDAYRMCRWNYSVSTDESGTVIPNEEFTEMGSPIVTNICKKCQIAVHQCDGGDDCDTQSGITCHCCGETVCFSCAATFQRVHSSYMMQYIWCNQCFDRVFGAERRANTSDYLGKCRWPTCRECGKIKE